jgi:small subunit ribosomal protein S1
MVDEMDDMEDTGEESFAELFEKSFSGGVSGKLEPGQKVEAKVLSITKDWVFLDVGQKGEGVLDRKELLDADGNLKVAEGDVLTAYFLSRAGGELRFTTRLGGGTGNAQLEEAWRSGIPVEGTVEKEIKGGFEVKLAGNTRAFCPFSQMALRRTEDPGQFIGKTLSFKISQYAERGRNVVVSHRAILEEEQRHQRETLRTTLREGMSVPGVVTQLKPFGAFVDIGGIEGLIPISEVAWGRVEDINEVLSIGQQVEVAVKSLDWETNRFSFSLKEAQADPWRSVADKFLEGMVLTGKVVRLAPFGAFVALGEGIDGLVHISKLGGGKRISHPREAVKEGQSLTVKIEKIDAEARRISLVLPGGEGAAAAEPEEDFRQYLPPSSGGGMGTFGELLKKQQEKKKRR